MFLSMTSLANNKHSSWIILASSTNIGDVVGNFVYVVHILKP